MRYLDDSTDDVSLIFIPARGAQFSLFFSTLASLLSLAFLVRVALVLEVDEGNTVALAFLAVLAASWTTTALVLAFARYGLSPPESRLWDLVRSVTSYLLGLWIISMALTVVFSTEVLFPAMSCATSSDPLCSDETRSVAVQTFCVLLISLLLNLVLAVFVTYDMHSSSSTAAILILRAELAAHRRQVRAMRTADEAERGVFLGYRWRDEEQPAPVGVPGRALHEKSGGGDVGFASTTLPARPVLPPPPPYYPSAIPSSRPVLPQSRLTRPSPSPLPEFPFPSRSPMPSSTLPPSSTSLLSEGKRRHRHPHHHRHEPHEHRRKKKSSEEEEDEDEDEDEDEQPVHRERHRKRKHKKAGEDDAERDDEDYTDSSSSPSSKHEETDDDNDGDFHTDSSASTTLSSPRSARRRSHSSASSTPSSDVPRSHPHRQHHPPAPPPPHNHKRHHRSELTQRDKRPRHHHRASSENDWATQRRKEKRDEKSKAAVELAGQFDTLDSV